MKHINDKNVLEANELVLYVVKIIINITIVLAKG